MLFINNHHFALLCERGLLIDSEASATGRSAARAMVLLLVRICKQAQGPDYSVWCPGNKRTSERRRCVLLCVTVPPGELVFVVALSSGSTSAFTCTFCAMVVYKVSQLSKTCTASHGLHRGLGDVFCW